MGAEIGEISPIYAQPNFSEGSVTVTRDYKDGHYEELDTQNTSETHEDALEGRLSKNRYRNTSDLSNEVQRANASGNVPPTKFEAARSRFLLGATAFRTREMQKCASPFVEVRQIEFLARETPNYTLPRTCTHIPSMDMRERERFASQEAKRRGEIRSVAMIHRMTETEPQGFRQHNLSSTRTNVRFLSSLGRLVLSSMLDAKEQGAQRPEESTIIPFSESRYRSSDVGRAHLQTGEAHLL